MTSIDQFLAAAGLGLAAVVLLLQQSGIPIPIPTPLIVIAGGLLAAAGYYSLPLAFLAMLLALCIGGAIRFWVARTRVTTHGAHDSEGAEETTGQPGDAGPQSQGKSWFETVLGVALPGRRGEVIRAGGVSQVPFLRFLSALVVGCAIYAAWNFLAAYLAAEFIANVRTWTRAQILALAVALGVVVSLLRWLHKIAITTESMSGIREAKSNSDRLKLEL